MFRPAKLGRDPRYGPSDPAHEYIPGLTETWLGPLAADWGVEGSRATIDQRTNVYNRLSPDGSRIVLPTADANDYRPVLGGNFHASKSLDAWLAAQTPEKRQRAERLIIEAAVKIVRGDILPDLHSRTKHAGKEPVGADTAFVLFKHGVQSQGHYHFHVLLEVHNVAKNPDGKSRAVHGKPMFDRQGLYSYAWMAEVTSSLHREFGLVLRPTATGLEVKGLEPLREIRTPRQEQVDNLLVERGLPRTPKTLHWAYRETHADRDAGGQNHSAKDRQNMMRDALGRSLAWLRQKGVDVGRAVVEAGRATSNLYEQKKAEDAVHSAVRVVEKIGRHVTPEELSMIARGEGSFTRANPDRVAKAVAEALKTPEQFNLQRTEDGRLSTSALERARAGWGREVEKLGKQSASPPRRRSMIKARLDNNASDPILTPAFDAVVKERVRVMRGPDRFVIITTRAFQSDRRRVLVTAPEKSAGALRRLTGVPVQSPEALAASLGKTSFLRTFLELRKTRWRSAGHLESLYHEARRPRIELRRSDVLVVDARGANHRALEAILKKARKAGATVQLITDAPVITRPARSPSRGHRARGD